MIRITPKNINITIGTDEITIQDNYTLILGKVKKDIAVQFENKPFSRLLENLDLIHLEDLLTLLNQDCIKSNSFDASLELLDYIQQHYEILQKNVEIVKNYNKLIKNAEAILKFTSLLYQKKLLTNELEISKNYESSSKISAISDSIEKLEENINNNKSKLSYLEEDYFKWKNRVDQIKNEIDQYNAQILTLNKNKKAIFEEINRITRMLENGTEQDIKNSDPGISYADKIRSLQKSAKETQYDINKLKQKIVDSKQNLERFNPQYKIHHRDYHALSEKIEKDEARLKALQDEIKLHLDDDLRNGISLNVNEIKSIRSVLEVEKELKIVSSSIDKVKYDLNLKESQNSDKIEEITRLINELNTNVKPNSKNYKINLNEKSFFKTLDAIQSIEILLSDIEKIVNKLLSQIQIKVILSLTITEDGQEFYIHITYMRNERDHLMFSELTTPEKVFFIISLYISYKIACNSEYVLFSNTILPSDFNKRGSIFRTIRKSLPLIRKDDALKNYKYIFIVSNLELKKEIKDIKIINLNER